MEKIIRLSIMGIIAGSIMAKKWSKDKSLGNIVKWGCGFASLVIIIHIILLYTFQ